MKENPGKSYEDAKQKWRYESTSWWKSRGSKGKGKYGKSSRWEVWEKKEEVAKHWEVKKEKEKVEDSKTWEKKEKVSSSTYDAFSGKTDSCQIRQFYTII